MQGKLPRGLFQKEVLKSVGKNKRARYAKPNMIEEYGNRKMFL